MNEGYKNVPALLIGLGGIGSEIVDNVYGRLKETGMAENVEALVFDIDNTISPYDCAEPDEWALGVLDNIKKEGFKICLLSNNNENRMDSIAVQCPEIDWPVFVRF